MNQFQEQSVGVASAKLLLNELTSEHLDQLELLYQTAPIGLCVIDRNLRYISINQALASFNGKPVEDHIGRSLYEVIPEIRPIFEPIYRRIIETGEPALNLEFCCPTPVNPKEDRYWLVNLYPLKDDDGWVQAVSTIVQDITKLKLAESTLRRSRQRLQALAESTKAVPWVANAKTGQFTYVGPQVIELV